MSEKDIPRTQSDQSIAEVGEAAVIAAVTAPTSHSHTLLGPGDDAAVVASPHGHVIVSTDMLVEGRHFQRQWMSDKDIGRRAIAQNAADIAAMGARCTGFVIAVGAPSSTPVSVLADIAAGAREEADRVSADVVGGDCTLAPNIVITVTALGTMGESLSPRTLAGARPGDTIALSGYLGWSRAGYEICSGHYVPGEDIPHHYRHQACERFACPEVSYEAGPAAAQGGATSLTDVSDGLWRDLSTVLAHSSKAAGQLLSADISGEQLDHLPDTAELTALAPDEHTLRVWQGEGGEDHCLLATFPSEHALPQGFYPIGRVKNSCATVITVDGEPLASCGGWDSMSSVLEKN